MSAIDMGVWIHVTCKIDRNDDQNMNGKGNGQLEK